jgi:hypothetical protein
MKLSISLSTAAHGKLGESVMRLNSNVSAIVETALRVFSELDPVRQRFEARQTLEEKRGRTRPGWMMQFWQLLAEEQVLTTGDPMGGDAKRVYAPRPYAGFVLAFLVVEDESADFQLHVMEQPEESPRTPRTQYSASTTLIFERNELPSVAAERVTGWMNANARQQ